ncbi:MAG: flagellar motor protein MotB [Chitinophagaceae bacterium]|nr:MAG: flagellar motor protein MotB [Chitinophagaceae bacterium]
MKKLTTSLLAIFCTLIAPAQFANDYLLAADKYFADGDYYSAAQYYEKFLADKGKGGKSGFNPYEVSAGSNKKAPKAASSREQVIYNLAESYRQLHYHEKALPYYEQADKKQFPLAAFHYATTLKALGRYEEAATAFQNFTATYATKDLYTAAAERELKSLDYIKEQLARKNLNRYTVEKAGAINGEGGTYAPAWLNNETLLFTSTRPDATDKNKSNSNRIYQASYSNGTPGAIMKTAVPQGKDIQQGVVAVTPTGNTLFLTRWEIAKGKKTSTIYSSTKTGDTWSDPVAVANLNVAGSNSQQPFVTPDGKNIIFSSDRAGGQGGFDLWMADLTEATVGTPTNMGSSINTSWDEQAPSYHAASKSFVFSSNGRVGMGGFDFYYSNGAVNNLSEPKNFGYPVNSIKDDIYFASKGSATNILEAVLFSSDRDAACCLELFSLNKVKLPKQITGRVLNCEGRQPLAGVAVSITDASNKVIAQKTTDASGNYAFTLAEFEALKASASQKGYFAGNVNFIGPADAEEESFTAPDICLNIIPEEAIRLDNVYYDFNKATLQPESYPSLDTLVNILNENPSILIELAAHTDSKGTDEYNQNLSQARAKSVVDYLISKGIDKARLLPKGYGETMPVADNENTDGSDNPEGRQRNRRTEFKVLKTGSE